MGEFLRRLKQRKLVQWALAYLAGAFAVLQGTDIVAQRFGWPETVERGAIVFLGIGFFATLVLAWYHGERGAQRASGPELLLLALLMAIGGAALWHVVHGPQPRSVAPAPAAALERATAPRKSIAVLPFTDLSPGHDQEYFSDGMAEEILNALAKVKELKVAGRTSSFSFKGRNEDLRDVGRLLSVANVLEGSVRKQGDRVRITAQLIHTDDGYHLWSQSYDGDLTDVFALQERIARAITQQLAVVIAGDAAAPLVKVATASPEAYALYLQAGDIFNRRDGAHFPQAIAALEKALAIDPDFARAHSRLAAIQALEPIYVPASSQTSRAAVEREARRASELDPTLAEPQAALGVMYSLAGRWQDAHAAHERALAIDPDDINAAFWAGVDSINEGYTASGNALFDRVLAIDPLLPNALLWRGMQFAYAGDMAQAQVLLRRAEDVGLAHVGIGLHLVEAAQGRREQAAAQLANGLRVLGPGLPADAPAMIAAGVYGNAAAHAAALVEIDRVEAASPERLGAFVPYSLLLLGESKRALVLLQRRRTNNDALFFHLLWSPALHATRALPEFTRFTRQTGLVDLWDRYGPPDACRRRAPGDYACD